MLKQQRIAWVVGGFAGVVLAAVVLGATVVDVAAQAPQQGRIGRQGPGRPGAGVGVLGRGGLNLPSLTDGQRQQIRAVVEQHRDEIRGLAQRAGAARAALRASAEAGQVDESQASELASATTALAVARARMQVEALQMLTPEQRQELKTRRDQMQQWMSQRPGGPGGPGGRGRGARGPRGGGR